MRYFSLFTFHFSLLLIPLLSHARPGDLDTAFGEGGWVVTTLGNFSLKASDIEIQTDGKVVLCGYAENDTTSYFMVARYHPDGRLDETFLGNQAIPTPPGIVIRNLPASASERGYACALQPDGKIVVVGHGYVDGKRHFVVARYRSENGMLDISDFDEGVADGWTYTPFESGGSAALEEEAHDVVIPPNSNKIIVVGYALLGTKKFAIARYNFDGSLDNSFDGDGKLVIDITGLNDMANGVAVQNDGKVVVAGYTSAAASGEDYRFAIARIKAGNCEAGSCLDTSFSGDGQEVTNIAEASDEMAYDVVIQPNGKIVAVGRAKVDDSWRFGLARYKSGGCPADLCLDRAVTTNFEGSTSAFATAVKIKENKIIVAGFVTVDGKQQLALTGYHLDTALLDESFGSSGKVIINNPSFENEGALNLAIQGDKILAVGQAGSGGNTSLLWSRHIDTFNSDLTVEMRQNEDPNLGPEERSYTVRVTNNGPDNAEDVVVTITPPAGAVMNALPYICTEEEMVITCDAGDIANGAVFTFGFVTDLSGAADNSTFTLNVMSGENDLNTDNNVAFLNINKQVLCDPAVCDPVPEEATGGGGGCFSLASEKKNGIYLLSMIGLVLLLFQIRKATKIVMLPRPTKRRTKEPFFKP